MPEYVFFVPCIFPFKDSIIGQIQVRENPCPAKMLMVLYLNALLVFSEASPETNFFLVLCIAFKFLEITSLLVKPSNTGYLPWRNERYLGFLS